jgi:hypothetical protein
MPWGRAVAIVVATGSCDVSDGSREGVQHVLMKALHFADIIIHASKISRR